MSTILYMIRHGEIDANVSKRWHGSTDSHLNNTGRHQAERLAEHFAVSHPEVQALYVSPLSRTRQTAEPLARRLALTPRVEDALREYALGELEDTPYSELHEKHDFYTRIQSDNNFAPPGGDSPNQVRDRFVAFLDRVKAQHVGESIALVSHGAAMGVALSHLLDRRIVPFYNYHMGNTGYARLHLADDPELQLFNELSHLSEQSIR